MKIFHAVKFKKFVLLAFLFSIIFNTFHDYFFVALKDKNIQVIALQESEDSHDKNVDIHKVLHSPFLVLDSQILLQEPFTVHKKVFSQNLNQKPIQKEIFKPPIFPV
ncbi:MAG: hypothetical protein C0198_01805 [Sulfurihydrogenibium sp.]|nr:MAG: hypothetical protein C0198_01805 [Sulfurihydrogenibium sp.]